MKEVETCDWSELSDDSMAHKTMGKMHAASVTLLDDPFAISFFVEERSLQTDEEMLSTSEEGELSSDGTQIAEESQTLQTILDSEDDEIENIDLVYRPTIPDGLPVSTLLNGFNFAFAGEVASRDLDKLRFIIPQHGGRWIPLQYIKFSS